jgi:ABC-2 type transport system ATP-binding protein
MRHTRLQRITSPPDDAAIRVANLTKRYGSRACVDDLSFVIPSGVVCGFIGRNGAGKTTTIRLLLGLIRPTSGTAVVLGESIDHPETYLHRVGAMIEGPAFYPSLTARQNLKVLAQIGGINENRIAQVLHRVDLAERSDDQYRTFSLGMKQRLGIAAALLPSPELLVLDEPTNGLDPQGIREIRTLLRTLADEGLTVLVSSHLLDELQHVCEHVVFIDEGQLRFDGTIDELLDRHQPTLIAQPEHPDDRVALVALCSRLGVHAVVDGDVVRINAPTGFASNLNRMAMAVGITLSHLAAESTRLEDVYFSLAHRPNHNSGSPPASSNHAEDGPWGTGPGKHAA